MHRSGDLRKFSTSTINAFPSNCQMELFFDNYSIFIVYQ